MNVTQLHETIYTLEQEIDYLGTLLNGAETRQLSGVTDDDLDHILAQYNDTQCRVRNLIAQVAVAQHYKERRQQGDRNSIITARRLTEASGFFYVDPTLIF